MKPVKQILKTARSAFSFSAAEEQSSQQSGYDPSLKPGFDPLDPDFVEDPYPMLRYLRDHDPVHQSPAGPWVLTRYQDIYDALSDRRIGNTPSPYAVVNERNRDRYVCADVANNIIPFLDVPKHTAPRKLISRVFLETLKKYPPDTQAIALSLLEKHTQEQGSGPLDMLEDFGTPLSIAVVCQLLGIPEKDHKQLKHWSEYFFYLFSIIPSKEVRKNLDNALVEFRAYLQVLVEERKASPQQDVISMLLAADPEGECLSEIELIDTIMLLFADGVENVDAAIANAAAILINNPDQLQRLKEQPELMSAAVDECLRLESPAQFVGRSAVEDFELHGKKIKKGDGILLVVGSANRDERVFDQPDMFNLQRSPNNYLSFGRGRHSCVGGSMVKSVMTSALTVLINHYDQLSLADGTVKWEARLGHRWPENVFVTGVRNQR